MMVEKRFEVIFEDGNYLAMPYFYDDGEEISDYEVVDLLNALHEENERLKCINDQIDEEILTNMECLMLLIPFVIFFILLTGIIIAFLVQLGWVVI